MMARQRPRTRARIHDTGSRILAASRWRLVVGITLSASLANGIAAQQPAATLQPFRNQAQSFTIDLPPGWRQLAPNEARRIGALPGAPADLGYVEPRLFYAVGPVDEWLQGRFDSPWLWVVEQDNEWLLGTDIEADVAPKLVAMWQAKGAVSGVQHEVSAIRNETVGPRGHAVLSAHRTSTPKDTGPASGSPATASLDVHAPAGGREYSLSFTCRKGEFDRHEPEFRRWLGTLNFARPPHGEQKVSDRLWTPIFTGAAVSLVLLLLYKHTRRRTPG